MKVKASRNVVCDLSVFVALNFALLIVGNLLADIFKGFAVNFGCVGEVAFA